MRPPKKHRRYCHRAARKLEDQRHADVLPYKFLGFARYGNSRVARFASPTFNDHMKLP